LSHFSSDVDIDVPASVKPGKLFGWTLASQVTAGALTKHPCGVYPQNVPIDPLSGLCAIPYDEAEELDYIKIDFLHLKLYEKFNSREEIEAVLELQPDWGLLLIPENQQKLFQLSKHGDILREVRPRSIDELADVLALIRPGKRELLQEYLKNRKAVRRVLYAKDKHGYAFKKAHSYAYATVIILQLHLMDAGLL
jgi:DNA polymerase III alpha subunit